MRYYLDCEFNGFGGELISLALLSETKSYYAIFKCDKPTPWVATNVVPFLKSVPSFVIINETTRFEAAHQIQRFLRNDTNPIFVCDWPDDAKYVCELITIEPGKMVNIPKISFEIISRADPYGPLAPVVEGAVRHNAWWDAQTLKAYYEEFEQG